MQSIRTAFVLLIGLESFLSCVGEVGTQGSTGPQGEPGPQGQTGAAASSFNDCPIGYTRDFSEPQFTVCKRGLDTVVKVGRLGSAFWMDRFEASLWEKADGTGTQYGATGDNYPAGFSKNGQLTTEVFALSVSNVAPSRFLTWFQANEACAASGKRLPTNAEWQRAARGTIDPGDSDGTGGACVTSAAGPRNTGLGVTCMSAWGAQDMIGNVLEMTAEWILGPGTSGSPGQTTQPWQNPVGTPDPLYNSDAVVNVSSTSINVDGPGGGFVAGTPSVLLRGGVFGVGPDRGVKAGLFAIDLNVGPSFSGPLIGVRCVVTQ